jgi:hypothetical protein
MLTELRSKCKRAEAEEVSDLVQGVQDIQLAACITPIKKFGCVPTVMRNQRHPEVGRNF